MLLSRQLQEAVAADEMTDADVHKAVASAKKIFKVAETKARNKYARAKKKAVSFFGSSDVEQAARQNALMRAEKDEAEEVLKARRKYAQTLDDIRARAGRWADLVPEVRA